jgi:hypothetical protein
MFTWIRLPRDVRFLILETFCAELVHDYFTTFLAKQDLLSNAFDVENPEDSQLPQDAPAPSSSLESFVSAIQTSNEFNNLILNCIRLHGISTRLYLQQMQHLLVSEISNFAEGRSPHSWRAHPLILVGGVEFLRKGLGNFWKNPVVIEDKDLLPSVLRWSGCNCNYIPLLEPYLAYHSVVDPHGYADLEPPAIFYHNLEGFARTSDGITRQTGQEPPISQVIEEMDRNEELDASYTAWDVSPRLGIKRVQLLDQVAGIVDGIAPSGVDGHLLLEADLMTSPGAWWYLPEMSVAARELDILRGFSGTFVNFKERRMYAYPRPERAVVWEDPHDRDIWEILDNVEDLEEYRRRIGVV